MAESAFTADEVDVKHVFNNDYRFVMPSYQRPYAWSEDETAELLQDLLGAMKDESGVSPYFLGSVVLVNKSGTCY